MPSVLQLAHLNEQTKKYFPTRCGVWNCTGRREFSSTLTVSLRWKLTTMMMCWSPTTVSGDYDEHHSRGDRGNKTPPEQPVWVSIGLITTSILSSLFIKFIPVMATLATQSTTCSTSLEASSLTFLRSRHNHSSVALSIYHHHHHHRHYHRHNHHHLLTVIPGHPFPTPGQTSDWHSERRPLHVS